VHTRFSIGEEVITQKASKLLGGWGFAPDPTRGAYRAPIVERGFAAPSPKPYPALSPSGFKLPHFGRALKLRGPNLLLNQPGPLRG